MELTKQEQEAIEREALKRFPKEFSDFNSYRQSGYRVGAAAYALRAKILVGAIEKVMAGTLNPTNILTKALSDYNQPSGE